MNSLYALKGKISRNNFVFMLVTVYSELYATYSILRYGKLEPFHPEYSLSDSLVNQTCQIHQPPHFLKSKLCYNL